MLPKKYRLDLRTQRNRVMASGRTLHSPFFTLIISPSKVEGDQEGVSHYSVITSVKFHPLSVKRHQAKRLIYQIIRDNLSDLPTDRDIIIIPKKPFFTVPKEIISADLLKLLNRTDDRDDKIS